MCPSCKALVYADALKQLAGEAELAEARRDIPRAVALWRQALDRLPRDTKQYASILERVASLGDRTGIDARRAEVDRVRAKYGKYGAVVSAVAAFLVKFKFVIVLLLTKGKLLLLGLTKLSTLSSMAVFLGFDARFLGWQLALGLVLSIYVHEMGHVAALHRHGIKASSPMFIPGLGAFIRSQQPIHGDWAEADIGLAGPLWGLGAAVVCYVIYRATGIAYWSTLAGWGALINAFNLIPIWQLDGAHAFKAMSRPHRVTAAAALLAAAVLSGQRMLWLPFIGASWAVISMKPRAPQRADARAVGYYVAIAGALSLLAALCRAPI
ncbi:MAG TPA: site-2 protease family protein [Gemmatimonadaceae bacterium]|nr:site-2 protease family protein [Gemmatimonadaceae bacterium]